MAFRTFGDLNSQLVKELDLEEETFIDALVEMKGYWNHAVSVAISHIATLGLKDKYFLSTVSLDTVQGSEEIALPANLYLNKIKNIVYVNGALLYEVEPLVNSGMFELYEYLKQFTSTADYQYMITHNTPGVEKLIIVPVARESATGVLKVWYTREPNRYTADSDICDMPAITYEYLHAYVKEMCYAKESHVNYDGAKADRMEKEQLMISVLSGQIDNKRVSQSEMDLTAYEESN
jgi:hypothetical protein